MNCSEMRSRISELLDKDLSYSDTQLFKGHLETCSGCADILHRMERIKTGLTQKPTVSLSPDFVPRLQERIRMDLAKGPSLWEKLTTPRFAGFSPLSLSGVVLAGVSALLIGVTLFQTDIAPIVAPPQTATQQTPADGIPKNRSKMINQGVPVQASAQVAGERDSLAVRRDSSRRDFSKQMQLVNQKRP